MSERPTSQPLLPGSSLGHFFIRELIGRGRTAVVYRAFDPRQRRDVALKVFYNVISDDPQAVECFIEEAAALQALNHPTLVRILTCDHEGDTFYMAMDLLRGATLRDLLTAQPAGLPHDQALAIFREIAQAVAYIHTQGVMHGNIKPDNIFIRPEGQPILAGFSLPCMRTTTEAVEGDPPDIGSLTYLAPEQVTHRTTTPQSDIYTLGILLHELTTGDVPFRAGTRDALTYQHLYTTPLPPSQRRVGVDPRIDAVVLRALSKNPRIRYHSISDLLHDLDQGALEAKYRTVVFEKEDAREVRRQQTALLRSRPASIPSPVPQEPAELPHPRNVLPLAITIVTLLIMVAVVVGLLLA
jgi:serine/threonine-protein kinase